MPDTPANLQEIARQLQKGEPSPRITVRVLLSWFGKKGRGSTVVQTIRASLSGLGLRTVPDFSVVYLDAEIAFELVHGGVQPQVPGNPSATREPREDVPPAAEDEFPDAQVGTRIGMLPSATMGITSVAPDDPISRAITLMMVNDFSQLPVMTGSRNMRGVISWRSIGEAKIHRGHTCKVVRECMSRDYELVRVEQPLLDVLPKIIQAEFVLVRDPTSLITGIVTTTDVSRQFSVLAEPYMLLGEIEGHVRQLIAECLTDDVIRSAGDPRDESRRIESVDDLTFGEYKWLLDKPENWEALPYDLDKNAFSATLDEIRSIRNEVMHFSQDGIDESARYSLRSLANCLRAMAARTVSA